MKNKKGSGFTMADTIYTVAVILLIAVILSGWPPYSTKASFRRALRWSSDGDRIPERAVERIVQKRFVAWVENPVVIEAVKQANAMPERSLDEIIQLDNKWIEGKCSPQFYSQFVENECADYLRKIQQGNVGKKLLYSEIFVMDKQGCIVAQTQRTSDYWQGDEDKFVKAFAKGKGAIFIGESDYDESTDVILIQVSVPVVDIDTGSAIGVMTVGMNIGVLDEQI